MSDDRSVPDSAERGPVRLKTVATVLSHAEADLIVGLLQAYGISAFTASDDAGGAYPGLGFAGVRVMVDEADAAQAGSVLEQTTGEASG
jgi:type III secretory pathway lipoprotein EscJ